MSWCVSVLINTSVTVSRYRAKVIYDPLTYPISCNEKAIKNAIKYSLQLFERWCKNFRKYYKCYY